MPITDELQDLVGNPVPPVDLAHRARVRGEVLRRRRMASVMTSVVAVGVLAVPGAVFVHDRAGSIGGAAGSGRSDATSAASAKAAAAPAELTAILTTFEAGHVAEVDQARITSAKTLLGSGFTETTSGVVVDAQTGAVVGTAATFTARDGGGSVGIEWTKAAVVTAAAPTLTAAGAAPAVAPSAAVLSPVIASARPAGAPGAPAEGTIVQPVGTAGGWSGTAPRGSSGEAVTGTVVGNAHLQVSVKVVQGKAGSPAILPGNAAITFGNDLLKAAG